MLKKVFMASKFQKSKCFQKLVFNFLKDNTFGEEIEKVETNISKKSFKSWTLNWRSTGDVVYKVLTYDIVIREFEFHLRYSIHFQNNTTGKEYEPP